MNIELKDKNGITLKTAGKYCSEDVGIVPKLQSKSVATNGSVVADEGYCGLDSVTVAVPATPTQEKTVDLAMASGDQVISPDAGKNLSKVTVTKPSTLVASNIKTGVSIGGVTGTLEVKKEEEAKTVDLNMASGNQTITPTSGKVLSQVVVKKPATMLPENIKKDVNIGGVTGTLESGGGGELNIAYGDTAPEDTSKLWIKSEEPSNISFPVVWNPEQIVEGVTETGVTLLDGKTYVGYSEAIGTKIYIFGGGSSDVQIYDTTSNTIEKLSAVVSFSYNNMSSAAVGTKIYFFGGHSVGSNTNYSSNAIRVFDTANNTIQTLSTTLRSEAYDIGVATVGTKIYLFGGIKATGSVFNPNVSHFSTIQVFDTANNTIQTLSTSLGFGAYGIGAATVGTKIYLFGGYDDSSYRNTIQVFDTANNTIQTLSTTLGFKASNIRAATVGTKIYLFGGHKGSSSYSGAIQIFDTTNNTIQTLSTTVPTSGSKSLSIGIKIYFSSGVKWYQFTVDVPLSSNDIIVTQEYYSRTFKVLKAPTEVEVACKYVYKGDQNLAKFIDAYLYDGANWQNVNTGDLTFTKLYAPKISISGKTLTITNDGRNGSKVTNYKVYNGGTLLTTITATTLDLTTVITANGTYNISVIATGTGYTDSNNSNVVEYNYGVYNITTNLTNVTANASNPTTVSTVASSTLTFTASTGYNLPDNVTVTGAEFTWTKSSGTLVLSNPTGAVSVTVSGVAISRTITATLTNVTAASGNATTIATGETKVLTYTANSGYNLPDTVTVTGATGVWNKDAGTLMLSNPTANVTFTIAGVEEASGYNVTVTAENYDFNIYDGQSASGTKLGSLNGGGDSITVVCTSGYLYFSTSASYGNITSVTGGVTIVNDYTVKVTGDGTVSANYMCMIEGTQITLADGTTKAIEDITYDDELLVWNFYDGKFDKAKPSWIKVEETAPRYNLVKFSNGSEVGFVGAGGEKGYHRIFNKKAGAFTYTGNFKETPNGTTTFAQDGTFPTVISQEVVEKEVKFYNVITDNHYNLFANGILTSCRLSNKYRIEDMKYVGEKLISDEQEKAYFERIESKRK